MKYFLLCSLLIMTIASKSQLFCQMQEKGTLVLAGICNNGGIVVITDSRTSFTDQNDSVSAYYDQSPKLYRYKDDIVFSMEGKVGFIKKQFHETYEKFKKVITYDIPVTNFLNELFKFMKKELDADDFKIFSKNKFFVCGTLNNEPRIIFKWENQLDTLSYLGEYRISFPKDLSEQIMRTILRNDPAHIAVNKFKIAFERFLEFRNNEYRQRGQLYVSGGPLSICTIVEGKINVIADQRSNYYSTRKDFYEAWKSNKVNMTYRSRADSIAFSKMMQNYVH